MKLVLKAVKRKPLIWGFVILCGLGAGWFFIQPPATPCAKALKAAHAGFDGFDCARDVTPICIPAAEQDDVDGMIFMAEAYYQADAYYLGKCGIRKDSPQENLAEARRWYTKAEALLTLQAKAGSRLARRKLDYLYKYTMLGPKSSDLVTPVDALYDQDLGELNYTCPIQKNLDQGVCFR